jgi:HlyD family secretion protein
LFSLKGQTYVFKIVGNTLVRTPVTTGIVKLTHAAIISGLQQGDWVARGTTTGQPLQEGVSIKVVK